ncbi:MAG: diphosphomevalonate decarboxylase [Labilithrix sp.]|nr:diphosphomevalonate decarboxylase [Labilithrix sp.]MCW5813747.1 diphosphomevalonate decarboxylase [Labilithrix sp.]
MTKAVAIAHPNIALSKYWGKKPGEANVPAVPSLSVTLAGLATTTSVTFDDALTADALTINGAAADATRATELLDHVRAAAKIRAHARVVSTNDFPTASGLASSASGFAALAVAAVRAAGLDWPAERVADLARRSSASAARSLFGGFVELDGDVVRAVAPSRHVDLRVLVCVTTEAAKAVSSRAGMNITAAKSPYYAGWLEAAPRIHRALKEALLAGDLPRAGELAEESALAMHASAFAAGVVYVSGATLDAYATVKALRADGIGAWATMDAGPHLKCLVAARDAAAAKERLAKTPGVLRVIEAAPGEGARVVETEPSK